MRTCREASVLLTTAPYNTDGDSYEIVIGAEANHKTVIKSKPSNTIHVEVSTSNVLNCEADKAFWLTWTRGSIRFGEGFDVGKSQIIDWTPENIIDIKAWTFSSYYKTSASWSIPTSNGMQLNTKRYIQFLVG